MSPAAAASRGLASVGAALLFLAWGCGKKAPLRLPEQLTAESTRTPGARVREGRVRLDFRVPRHRVFPEREDPWVLARVLRRPGASQEFIEAGTIHNAAGFAFDEKLSWTDSAFPPGSTLVYRVEFRDAARQRRALSGPLTVTWDVVPAAPVALSAAGDDNAVRLSWGAPPAAGDAVRYRVYRRVGEQAEAEPLGTEAAAPESLVDTRVETGQDYCYSVRAVLGGEALEVEGPASEEICVRTERSAEPPAP